MTKDKIIDEIFAAFAARGQDSYGEYVNMQEHMLQSAMFAENDGEDPLMIAACLVHDIGHLVHDLPEDIADQGIDTVHEELGADYLRKYFVPAVIEPGRLHVAAKRYLCATDDAYFATLTPASVQSLELQGGPYTAEEVAEFEKNPFHKEAVILRRYDEMGKEPELETPELEHYREVLKVGIRPEFE